MPGVNPTTRLSAVSSSSHRVAPIRRADTSLRRMPPRLASVPLAAHAPSFSAAPSVLVLSLGRSSPSWVERPDATSNRLVSF